MLVTGKVNQRFLLRWFAALIDESPHISDESERKKKLFKMVCVQGYFLGSADLCHSLIRSTMAATKCSSVEEIEITDSRKAAKPIADEVLARVAAGHQYIDEAAKSTSLKDCANSQAQFCPQTRCWLFSSRWLSWVVLTAHRLYQDVWWTDNIQLIINILTY